MEDWIKEGNKCYVDSFVGWVHSGEATIEKVGRKYFYLEGYPKIKIDIPTLCGLRPGYSNICGVYRTKADLDRKEEMYRKRRVVMQKQHLLTDEEIIEIYNTIIQRDR